MFSMHRGSWSALARTLTYRPIMRFNSIAARKKKPLTAINGLRKSTNIDSQSILKLLNTNDVNVESEISQYLKTTTAITIGDSIVFSRLFPLISHLNHKVVVPDEVVCVKVSGNKDVMVLANGTIAGWDVNESILVEEFVPLVEPAVIDKCDYESDEFDYIEIDQLPSNPKNSGNSYMAGEIMIIQGADANKKLLDKVAFSIGLSRSTRLSIIENGLEELLKNTKSSSKNLALGLKLSTSEPEILQLTGKLFLLRGKLNLYNELIDTPDLYWSEPTLEKIYQSVSQSLDINLRISILNRKLDYATDEQRAFLALLNEQKGTRLEWIIIILIMVEVCFECFRFITGI